MKRKQKLMHFRKGRDLNEIKLRSSHIHFGITDEFQYLGATVNNKNDEDI